MTLTPADRARLVESHFAMAARQARRFAASNHLEHIADELESAAMLGLVKAARLHDPSTGAKFSSYAYRAIHNEMLMALDSERRRARGAIKPSGYAEATGHRSTDVGEVWREQPHPDRAIHARQVLALVHELPERTREAIRLHFFEGLTYEEAAERMGMTKAGAVNQISRALDHLAEVWAKRERRTPVVLFERRDSPRAKRLVRVANGVTL